MSTGTKASIGQAIDQVIAALQPLEKREQEIVIGTVCSILEISTPAKGAGQPARGDGGNTTPNSGGSASSQVGAPAAGSGDTPDSTRHPIDIRTLKEQKQPSNVLQMACVVAFYLQEHAPPEEQTKEVTAADLERLFKQANYKLPSRMQQVLVDAKGAGYFESVDRGKYKLTRVGYNLVTHSLPRAAAK
jgi:hypothetical protein